jgi:hypothetical protein
LHHHSRWRGRRACVARVSGEAVAATSDKRVPPCKCVATTSGDAQVSASHFRFRVPAQPRAGLLPHFLPHLQQRRLLSLPLSILPPKSKLFSVDFSFPKSPKVLPLICHSFDPLEFAYLVLNPQILETLEILIHPNCNVNSC